MGEPQKIYHGCYIPVFIERRNINVTGDLESKTITGNITQSGQCFIDLCILLPGGKMSQQVALIDTGSSYTVVTKLMADVLKLEYTGRDISLQGAGDDPKMFPEVKADIYIPIIEKTFPSLIVADKFRTTFGTYGLILGTDILGLLAFTYNVTYGKFTLDYPKQDVNT